MLLSTCPANAGHARMLASIAIASATLSMLTVPCVASAQSFAERFALRGEFGVGTMLATYQRNTMGYGLGVQGSGRLAFTLYGPLAIQASYSSWWFSAESPMGVHADGGMMSVTGGLRLEPMAGRVGRFFLDANVGLGVTAERKRVALDAGLGFEFAFTPALGIGPALRYGRLFASADAQDFPSDAQYWSGGLSLSLRIPPPPPSAAPVSAPLDSDRDGVTDPRDECPYEPAGAHPDAQHLGCPERDRDHDGVLDRLDVCPDVPVGEHPSPVRLGCPASDSDHDGFYDYEDNCPATAVGPHPDPERRGCPDGDDDSDGVLNQSDLCRRVSQGARPDPARLGCPVADRDHDSVPDAVDACPDVVGAPSVDPRRNGCPGLVVVRDGMIVILQPVFFATNRDTILRPSFGVLSAVVSALNAQPEIRRVGIEGHTDDVGTAEANMSLSQRRAQSVAVWLTRHGIDAGRIEARGYGNTHPIVPNSSSSGRAANRRVEFHILAPSPNNSVDPSGSSSSSAPASASVTGSASVSVGVNGAAR
jgi:outer membrane protein OmpA-like peptidoglycan-associated protein